MKPHNYTQLIFKDVDFFFFGNRIHIRRIIKENAVYEKRSTYRRCCWYVHAEVLTRHSQEALPVPCQWTYLTSGAQIPPDEPTGSQGNSPTMSTSTTPSNKRKSASSHSITKYMKKCGDSEQVQTNYIYYCAKVFTHTKKITQKYVSRKYQFTFP